MNASVVIGQPDLTSALVGATASIINSAGGIFVDLKGRLIISDIGNNRVLVWNKIPTVNSTSADLVLGQADFISNSANRGGSRNSDTLRDPEGIYSDGNKLIVADGTNSRVLIWNTFPTQNGQSADVVVGQTSMTAGTTTCNAINLSIPWGVMVYKNRLVVVDRGHRRVMIWNHIPTSNGESADVVLGQTDMTTCSTLSVSSTSMSQARGGWVDESGKLYVADISNHRILIWNSIPTVNNTAADVVVGQPDFASSSSGASATQLNNPPAVATDGTRLLIADSSNRRLLIYNSIPTSNGASADIVLGQPNFTSSAAYGGESTISPRSVNAPRAVYGNSTSIIVDGQLDHRVLIFKNVQDTPHLEFSSSPTEAVDKKMRLAGKLKITGNRYGMWKMEAAVNGGSFGAISYLSGNNPVLGEPGNFENTFYHDFEPWSFDNGTKDTWSERGYVVRFKTFTTNADTADTFTYFSPFTLQAPSSTTVSRNPTLTFSVNSYNHDQLKESLDHYQIVMKKEGKDWETYVDNIPIDYSVVRESDSNLRSEQSTPEGSNGIYENANLISTYINNSSSISVAKKGSSLPTGTYDVKVIAIDKQGNKQDSNHINLTLQGPLTNPKNLSITSENFPLQVNSISGVNSGVMSTFNPLGILPSYSSKTTTPLFAGIANSQTKITIFVTNSKDPTQTKTFTTTAKNSSWKLTPALYPNSTIDITAEDPLEQFTVLPGFTLTTISYSAQSTSKVKGITNTSPQPPSPTPQPAPNPSPSPAQKAELTPKSGIFGPIINFFEALFK